MNWAGLSVVLGLVAVAFAIHPVVGIASVAGLIWFMWKYC